MMHLGVTARACVVRCAIGAAILTWIGAAGMARAADIFRHCPSTKPSRDVRSCYEPCKPGYEGAGPVCYKKVCDEGYTFEDGACYKTCPEGYYGRATMCIPECPSPDFRDDGLYCAKPASYGRGAGYPWKFGDPLNLDNAWKRCEKDHGSGNCEQTGEVIYPKCRSGFHNVGCCTCSPDCGDPAKYVDIGVSCQKKTQDRGVLKLDKAASYGRGYPIEMRSCEAKSFTKPCDMLGSGSGTDFSVIFVSDPQIPWYGTAGAGVNPAPPPPLGECPEGSGYDDCRVRKAIRMNELHVAGLKKATTIPWPPDRPTGKFRYPAATVFNGDLTAFWHPYQVDWFTKLYVSQGIPGPLFLGLGNHDYANNVGDCAAGTTNKNECAQRAVRWMQAAVQCGHVPGFGAHRIHNYDKNSLAYSWDIGMFHFVQLHNYPTYPEDDKVNEDGVKNPTKNLGMTFGDSIEWLKKDLQAAQDAGALIILNLHDLGEHMKRDNARFLSAINGRPVVAIFAGHLHARRGRNPGEDYSVSYIDPVTKKVGVKKVPVFRSGSSAYGTYLAVDFSDVIRVAVIDTTTGEPKAVNHDSGNLVEVVSYR